MVDGRTVGDKVSNRASIRASFHSHEYRVARGIREVPMSAFEITDPQELFYAADDIRRTKRLARDIEASGRIDPLIVVVDDEGAYVLEGGHRLGALHLLGAYSLPALVVEHETPNYEAAFAPDPPRDIPEGLREELRELERARNRRMDIVRDQLGPRGGRVEMANGDVYAISRNPNTEEAVEHPWRVTRLRVIEGDLTPTGHTVHMCLDAPGEKSVYPIGAVQEVANWIRNSPLTDLRPATGQDSRPLSP